VDIECGRPDSFRGPMFQLTAIHYPLFTALSPYGSQMKIPRSHAGSSHNMPYRALTDVGSDPVRLEGSGGLTRPMIALEIEKVTTPAP